MKNDFNKDLNDIEDFNLGLDSKSEKEKGLLVFEIFVFLMIIYKTESEYLKYFLKIEKITSFYETDDLKMFLSDVVNKVNIHFNHIQSEKNFSEEKIILEDLENQVFHYQNLIEEMTLKNENLQKINNSLQSQLNSLKEEEGEQKKKNIELNCLLSVLKKDYDEAKNFKEQFESKEIDNVNRIEKLKKNNQELNVQIGDLNNKIQFLIFEKDNLLQDLSKMETNYVKIEKYNLLIEENLKLKKKISQIKNSLHIENSEKSDLQEKIQKMKESGLKMELENEDIKLQMFSLEKRFSSVPKKNFQENVNTQNFKKSLFEKNEKFDSVLKKKLQKMNLQTSDLNSLELSEIVFENKNVPNSWRDSLIARVRNEEDEDIIAQEDLEENNLMEENISETNNDINELESVVFQNSINNDKEYLKMDSNPTIREKVHKKDFDILKKENSNFHKGFLKIKKLLGIRNKNISFGIIFTEIEILQKKVKSLNTKYSEFKRDKMKFIDFKNQQISILYNLLVKS